MQDVLSRQQLVVQCFYFVRVDAERSCGCEYKTQGEKGRRDFDSPEARVLCPPPLHYLVNDGREFEFQAESSAVLFTMRVSWRRTACQRR